MDFLISSAYAQQAAPQGSLLDLWPLVVIFIAFYFLLIRPQVGDEVMTAGGILGRITAVSDHYAVVQISDNTEIKIQKSSVSQVVPKGTFEEA